VRALNVMLVGAVLTVVIPSATSSPASAGDELPFVSLGVVNVAEGGGPAQTVLVPVTLQHPVDHRVVVEVVDDHAASSATPGVDYRLASKKVTIPAGQVAGHVRVVVYHDGQTEDDEFVMLRLTSASGARILLSEGSVVIYDDGPSSGAPVLHVGAVSVVETDAGNVKTGVPWVLSEPLDVDLAVFVAPEYPQPASPPSYDASFEDFRARPRIVWIPAGRTSGRFALTVYSDVEVEPAEAINLDVQPWGDPRVTVAGLRRVWIIDNDAGPLSAVRELVASPLTGAQAGWVDLTWNPPEQGMSPYPYQQIYEVSLSTDGGATFGAPSRVISETATVWCGAPSVHCVLRVRAIGRLGPGPWVAVEVVTPGLPDAPADVSAPPPPALDAPDARTGSTEPGDDGSPQPRTDDGVGKTPNDDAGEGTAP